MGLLSYPRGGSAQEGRLIWPTMPAEKTAQSALDVRTRPTATEAALPLPAIALGISSAAPRTSERLRTKTSNDNPRGEAARLGRLLASASGYDVRSSEGRSLGQLEHVRYRQHTDHPDEIVIKRLHLLWKRRRVLPFNTVEAVDPSTGTVTLRPGWDAGGRAPPA